MLKMISITSATLVFGIVCTQPANADGYIYAGGSAQNAAPAAAGTPSAIEVPGDHYQCYRVLRAEALRPEAITVADQFGKAQIVLGQPMLVCNPSIKVHRDRTYKPVAPTVHLVCYAPVRQSDKPRPRRVKIGNQFQITDLTLAERQMFCVPSRKQLIGEKEAPLG